MLKLWNAVANHNVNVTKTNRIKKVTNLYIIISGYEQYSYHG